MPSCLLIFVILVAMFSYNACELQRVDYTGFKVFKVSIADERSSEALLNIKKDLKIELWNDPHPRVGYSLALIHPDILEEVKKRLGDKGLIWETAIQDFQQAIEEERKANALPARDYAPFKPTIKDYNYAHYGKLDEVNKFLETATIEFPHLAESVTIGVSYENRTINGIRISSGDRGTKPAVFIECGIHAREWVSTATGIYIIGQLLGNYSSNAKIAELVDNFEWYIFPSVNPDGYHYTHTKDRNWRKTRAPSTVLRLCFGADLNRNFETNYFCGISSSRNPCDDEYCGDSAFSEKEARALRDFTRSLGPRLKIYFALHSFGQLWMYPYGYSTYPPPNDEQLIKIANIGAAALKSVNGKNYTVSQISHIFQASGSSVDWVYYNVRTRLVYALELRDRGIFGFMLPPGQILPTAREIMAGIQASVLATTH